ncbi:serine/threonine-protein kinase [Paludisphaera mucosa]|uniref:Serine/threonine-protein kinase n=1 Tax=Paludisphaera mucosa TaxID=3030827 RepID=A0ABT6FGT3_9BACT|nr:serine/threonine-protein kinase [Paludisphaera mucosa]MDG3006686.1 serine/threonine-protein kinase [Paludisphaera mucosa]
MDFADSGGLDQDGVERVDGEIARFEQAAAANRELVLRLYWAERLRDGPPLSVVERSACLAGLVKADLRRRFDLGEAPAVWEYLEEIPQLREADARMLSLVYEEFCLREEHGDAPDVESFCDRYPAWKDSLISQLGYHRILSKAAGLVPPKPKFPEVGERFEEFSLLALIGKGGYSRVYLSSDRSLGGKRVVLKISGDRGQEAETQGALDHPHIVPVNSVVYQPDRGLRGLSMPYRPGLPLDDVIRRVRRLEPRPSSARTLWDALVEGIEGGDAVLDEEFAAALRAGPTSDGWRGFPLRGTFAQGAAWIALVVARALAYAHDRRTYHRDVKPGNVLLTIQHGPQLLDFNLAQSPHAPREAQSAIQGGTLPYMAPEQIEAFLNPERWGSVGASADIYSLGLMLRELLTGQALDVPDSKLPPARALRELLDRRLVLPADVRGHDARTPHALEAIVRKCLRHDPADRYASGKDLAEDLERFLQRRPMVHNANPSRSERVRDWGVRNRRVLAANAFYLLVLALLSPLVIRQVTAMLQPEAKRRPEFHNAVQMVDSGRYPEAIALLTNLVEEDPAAPLYRFYLGFAHSEIDSRPQTAAEIYYSDAMKQPGAEAELLDWAKGNEQLAKHLRRLGQHFLNETTSNKNRGTEAGEAAFQRAMELSVHAFSTAVTLDPSSRETIYGLATTEEFKKNYDVAHGLLTKMLEKAQPSTDPAHANDPTRWRLQRSRVAVMLAKSLAGSPDSKSMEQSASWADKALGDLDVCQSSTPTFLKPLYYGLRTEVVLTLGEFHLRDGAADLLAADCSDAKAAMDAWFLLTRSNGDEIPKDVEDRYRRRLRILQDAAESGPRRVRTSAGRE